MRWLVTGANVVSRSQRQATVEMGVHTAASGLRRSAGRILGWEVGSRVARNNVDSGCRT